MNMSQLIGALLSAVDEVARSRGVENYRVQCKRSARGELIVALIIEDKKRPTNDGKRDGPP